VECFYYVLIPVVAAFAAKSSRNAFLFLAALGCLSMAACIVEPARTFDNSLSWLHKAAPFLAGSALALWTARRPAPPGRARPIAALAWLVAFGLLTGLYRELSFDRLAPAAAPWLSLGLAGAVAGLLHACGRHGWWRRTLASPALVWIGQVSFSLYLTHGFVIAVVRRLPVPSSTLAAWLSMALALALAGCCYRCIEKPGIRIGRRWGLRWAARPPTGARAPD
jgi:peptidoglycan/LPS O-acetylase OafA/YrhL